MADDTDRLPELPEDFDEFAETIVLEESDVMATREVRQLLDPDSEASEDDDSGTDEP